MGYRDTEEVRILHVDDDRQRTRLTERVLGDVNDGIVVVTETDVRTGLDRLAEGGIDCVVSDYEMPHLDGLEFLERVREEYPDLPFILFTGKGSEEIASEAISAGVTDYLQKGSGMENYRILANRIENAVAKREATVKAQRVYRAMEATEEGISLLDDDGRYTYVNQSYADLYGYDPDEMVGEHWRLVYPDCEIDRVNDQILPAVSENETWRGETTGLRSDGTTFVEDHTLTERDDGGLVCAVRDVTQQAAETGDRTSLTTEVLDTSDVGTVVVSESGEIVWLNEAVEEYFGLDRAECLGADHATVLREQVEPKLASSESFVERARADPERLECRVGNTDATEERWVERWTKLIESGPYAGGQIVHHKDVTERKRREEELVRRRHELERQTERLENFAGILSHDLRNPLSIARTYTEFLRDCDGVDGEAVAEIEQAHDRMTAIVEDVLTLAREDESIEKTVPVELSAVTAEAWHNVRVPGATLRVDTDCIVDADDVSLKRLFENLFRNAVEHGSTGNQPAAEDAVEHGSTGSRPVADDAVEHGSTGNQLAAEDAVEHAGEGVTVRVGLLEEGSGPGTGAGFYVEDDGPGIPEDERERAFEWGYSTATDGTGFGLAIVRQIAAAHGWEVCVTDGDDGGMRFEVTGVDVCDA